MIGEICREGNCMWTDRQKGESVDGWKEGSVYRWKDGKTWKMYEQIRLEILQQFCESFSVLWKQCFPFNL